MLKQVLALLFGVVATFTASTRIDIEKKKLGDVGSWTPHHPGVDNSTFANVDQVVVTHQHADWGVNFASGMLQGSIVFDMMVVSDTMYVSFDTLGNDIEDVQLLPAGSALAATMNAGVIPLVNNPVSYDVKINLNNQ